MPRHAERIVPLLLLLVAFLVPYKAAAQTDDPAARAVSLFQKGQDAHEKGDLPAAVDLYSQALELLPEFPEAEFQRGNAYLTLGKTHEAEASLRRALELREDWSLAMASLGSLLVNEKKYEEAGKFLGRSIELDAMNPLALSAMAELLIATKADAVALRSHLARLDAFSGKVRPTASVLTSRAVIEENLGNHASAKENALKAVQIDARSAAAYSLLAGISLSENDVEKADAYVKTFESLTPNSAEAATLRARVLFARGKKAEALAALESINEPSDAVKEMIAKIKDGDVADIAGLEAKLRRTPDDANVLSKLCVGYRVTDPAKALEYCRRASVVEPNELGHAVNFGAALVQAKQYVEAVGLFRKLLAIQPDHATARANLATALFQLKRFPEAKIEFVWLTEKQPSSAAAFYFLAIIHDQLGEYFDAMANYQQYLKLADPGSNKLEIEKVNLRLPALQKQIKGGKGKKTR